MLQPELERMGFDVVGLEHFAAPYEAALAELGPLYDGRTGAANLDTEARARRAAYSSLASDHDVEAIVVPEIVLASATVMGNSAFWDGSSESVDTPSSGGVTAPASSGFRGSLEALSLRLSFVDPEGTLLYEASGGIQILSKVDRFGNVRPVSGDALLTNPDRLQRAVEAALEPLQE